MVAALLGVLFRAPGHATSTTHRFQPPVGVGDGNGGANAGNGGGEARDVVGGGRGAVLAPRLVPPRLCARSPVRTTRPSLADEEATSPYRLSCLPHLAGCVYGRPDVGRDVVGQAKLAQGSGSWPL